MVVDDQQLLDAVRVQDLLGFLEADAGARGDEVVLGHHLGDGAVEPLLEAEVAVREDADELAVLRDRQTRDVEAAHDRERILDALIRAHGHRVGDHAALRLLHLLDLERLRRDRHVPMDEADAALLRDRDRHPRLGHGVHRRRDQRDVERDPARELGRDVGVARHDRARCGNQEHVVEGESLAYFTQVHATLPKTKKPPRGERAGLRCATQATF